MVLVVKNNQTYPHSNYNIQTNKGVFKHHSLLFHKETNTTYFHFFQSLSFTFFFFFFFFSTFSTFLENQKVMTLVSNA